MIIWGSAGETVYLCPARPAYCPFCEKECSFALILRYEYAHVWFIFCYVKQREYSLVCDFCQRGTLEDPDTVERRLGKVPIPFMRRFGCLVLLVIIVLLVLLRAIDRQLE
jgi:hypothetical protein